MKKILFALIVALCMMSAKAETIDSGTCGDEVTWSLSDDYTLTISGTGAMAGNPWAWEYRGQIRKLVIEDGVTSIGNWAFDSCTSLSSVTIPSSVTSIGRDAFYDCYVTQDNLVNESSVDLTEAGLTIVDTEQEDGLLITDGVVVKCRPYTTSVTIPNTVTSIDDYAFEDCFYLRSVSLPESVTNIGSFAFGWCYSLSSVLISAPKTNFDSMAFYCCYISADSIQNGFQSMFENLGAIVCDVEQEDGLLIRNDSVVFCRPSATSVTIPESVVGIKATGSFDLAPFSQCHNLSEITVLAVNPPVCEDYSLYDIYTGPVVYVPASTIDAYREAPEWANVSDIRPLGTALAEDVNGDGAIDTQDVLKVYEYMKASTSAPASPVSEDVNGDGTVDTQDVLKIYEYMKQN